MSRTRADLALVAPTGHTVLLVGETGTGKELAARELHRLSGRSGPLLAVNCASLRGELLESELFGHVRGAFTGAQRSHDGLFVRASRGTLLLDEVGELDEAVQSRLLRVLEAKAVRPVGASEEVPIGTRVVAATHRDLEAAVKRGRFRADLYGRLARWTVVLPSLRERREDLGVLTRTLLATSPKVEPSAELMAALLAHPWPLNVRGLVNVLSTATVAQPGAERLELVAQVAMALASQARLAVSDGATPRSEVDAQQEHGPERIEAALRAHRGNLTAVARELGLTRQSLYRALERLGLDPATFRGP
jgi:DNA-binding NtrC family response regulator